MNSPEPAQAPNAVSSSTRSTRPPSARVSAPDLPLLVTVDEVADLLRTTPTAVYAMVARQQIPGVTRLGRRVLFRSDDLLKWLDQSRAPSPRE
jgi:excisionase family DNA binding protein